MAETTVEDILVAIRRLPNHERRRLLESLQRDMEYTDQQTRVSSERTAKPSPEQQWLLNHPDFWDKHRGEHVALHGYEMIAVGKSRKDVIAESRRKGIDSPFVQYS